eukprot:310678-Chlamydomonas_euryale.AAC.3
MPKCLLPARPARRRCRVQIVFKEVGTPRTHRRFLNRDDGTYGPIPSRRPAGMLSMPFNT